MYGTERQNIRNIIIYIRGGGGGFPGNAETMLATPLLVKLFADDGPHAGPAQG